jgi:hypothetical protein
MVNASLKTKCVFEKELTKIFPQNPLAKSNGAGGAVARKSFKIKNQAVSRVYALA